MGRPEVHTIRGEGKRDMRLCVALPVRRYIRRRPGKATVVVAVTERTTRSERVATRRGTEAEAVGRRRRWGQ